MLKEEISILCVFDGSISFPNHSSISLVTGVVNFILQYDILQPGKYESKNEMHVHERSSFFSHITKWSIIYIYIYMSWTLTADEAMATSDKAPGKRRYSDVVFVWWYTLAPLFDPHIITTWYFAWAKDDGPMTADRISSFVHNTLR